MTFLAILKWTKINLHFLIIVGSVKEAKDWRLPLTFIKVSGNRYSNGQREKIWPNMGCITKSWTGHKLLISQSNRGFGIPAHSDAWEKNNYDYFNTFCDDALYRCITDNGKNVWNVFKCCCMKQRKTNNEFSVEKWSWPPFCEVIVSSSTMLDLMCLYEIKLPTFSWHVRVLSNKPCLHSLHSFRSIKEATKS